MPVSDTKNYQGGKAFGEHMMKFEASLDEINRGFEDDSAYKDVEDLTDKLTAIKAKFLEYDRDKSGDLNIQDVKYMMEKLDQAKTHLEVKKMIREVDSTGTETINYSDFVRMMIGPKSSVLKMIIMFEGMGKEKDKPKGPPPKRALSSLP